MVVTFIHSFIPAAHQKSTGTVLALTPGFQLCPSPLPAVVGYKCRALCNRPARGVRRMVTRGPGERTGMLDSSSLGHHALKEPELFLTSGHLGSSHRSLVALTTSKGFLFFCYQLLTCSQPPRLTSYKFRNFSWKRASLSQ